MAELDEGLEDESSNYDDETVAKNRFRYANRQQVILFGFHFIFILSELFNDEHKMVPLRSLKIRPSKVKKYLNLMTIFKLCIFSRYALQPKWRTFQQR